MGSCREEAEHTSALRQIPAFQTLAIVCNVAFKAGVRGQPSPIDVLREATSAQLQSLQAQERPERLSKSRAQRQVRDVAANGTRL